MSSSPSSNQDSPPSSGSPAVTAPGRQSVRELLAQLSDSDSDVADLAVQSRSSRKVTSSGTENNEQASSDDDLLVGSGRFAARLRGGQSSNDVEPLQEHTMAEDQAHKTASDLDVLVSHNNHQDILQPKRKLLLKRKRVRPDSEQRDSEEQEVTNSAHGSPVSARSSTPAARTNESSSPSSSTVRKEAVSAGKSRFQTLVEKARKERIERENAEEAKKAAREAQESTKATVRRGQRGSSPADDSEEESGQSDTVTARRLTRDARPTRKASKKAIEEMNRETQRMNRNMQLAHKTRTKKRYTKESFIASFSNLNSTSKEQDATQVQPTESSSATSSDIEPANLHSTPPTSPLFGPDKENVSNEAGVQQAEFEQHEDEQDDAPDLYAIIAERRAATALEESNTRLNNILGTSSKPIAPSYTTVMHIQEHPDSDSGSEIEVVYDKGLKRKYVAFENLPKRKAQEKASHVALRSLAQIKRDKDKRSAISEADMGPSLLRAARQQAQEERQAKIEKLRAAGVTIQTVEEREQDQEELEDLVERARQEEEEIRKREKELAKRDGTYQKDALDDGDSSNDEDFEDGADGADEAPTSSEEDSDRDGDGSDDDANDEDDNMRGLIDDAAEQSDNEDTTSQAGSEPVNQLQRTPLPSVKTPVTTRSLWRSRIIEDDEEEGNGPRPSHELPNLPSNRKTPQSVIRSARKIIPGLQHSDELSIGLTQAFAATMADSQTQENATSQGQDSFDILRDLPSPHIDVMPRLNRLESLDMISESVAGSQTQPLDLDLILSQSQRVPESPATIIDPSQTPFELTQDMGYSISPFTGNRYAETPSRKPQSTEDTVIMPTEADSPVVRRRGRLQRGQQASLGTEDGETDVSKSAFQIMKRAATRKEQQDFNKKQSEARKAIDEAAEESDDEYAGLGGASDDDSGEEENEDDRLMIDEDTQVGQGDEAKLAKLHADRERQSDEAAVSKLLKDITTGALRRKRGAGDDLDLSDEEGAVVRRREAKRREFAKLRRELLKDEAVGKIAEDKKKQAFLKSIEDHEDEEDDGLNDDEPELSGDADSREPSQHGGAGTAIDTRMNETQRSQTRPLKPTTDSQLNVGALNQRRVTVAVSRKPGTLAEIRETVSFLVDEADSQTGTIDLGLSDSEDEPEAYVDLDRHFQQAEADDDAEEDENEDLGDFIVDDHKEDDLQGTFKKPELPNRERDRAPFSERRTKSVNVVDRLSLLRQSSSSSTGSNASSKMAFFNARSGSGSGSGSLSNVPNLLRRATTNSSLGSASGRENVSATGVVTSKTERGSAAQEKEFVRKAANTSKNSINYAGRQNLKEEKMSARAGIVKKKQKKGKGGSFLNGLFKSDAWS